MKRDRWDHMTPQEQHVALCNLAGEAPTVTAAALGMGGGFRGGNTGGRLGGRPPPTSEDVQGQLKIVQGPPGCGKTHLLSALIHLLAAPVEAMCSKVMVCAPSNKGVCVALEKFLEVLKADDDGGGEGDQNDEDALFVSIIGVEGKILGDLNLLSSGSSGSGSGSGMTKTNGSSSVPGLQEAQMFISRLIRPQTVQDAFVYNYADKICVIVDKLRDVCRSIGRMCGRARVDDVVQAVDSLQATIVRLFNHLALRLPSFFPGPQGQCKEEEEEQG